MKVSSLPNKEKLNICQKYFMAGFICLPFMWAVNALWFFKEAFVVPAYSEQKKIKTYVVLSTIGAIIWMIGIITWIIYFQVHRSAWGATGDYLSFMIPKGAR